MNYLEVVLNTHPSVHWQEDGHSKIRGWFFDSEGFHEKAGALQKFGIFQSEDGFCNRIKTLNGNFSVIQESKDFVFAAVDRIASFSLFYSYHDSKVFVSDSVALLCEHCNFDKIDSVSLSEFRASGYVLGNRTLYQGVYKLEAGQYLVYDKKTDAIEIKDYHLHLHHLENQISTKTEAELCEELGYVVDDVFERLVSSINGKTIALFLSGGYDSRLVAINLRKQNYENVVCITFGKKTDPDVIVAEQVAATCGYKWISIAENGECYWRKKRKTGKLRNRLVRAKSDIGHMYKTGLFLEELIEDGTLPKDCVAITGGGGDILEGHLLSLKFADGKKYSELDVMNAIRNTHFYNAGYKKHNSDSFHNELKQYLLGKTEFTAQEAECIFDFFGWRVRHSQREVQDVRNYDNYLGNEWRLPLCDNALADFWLKVPLHMRVNRQLYYAWLNSIGEKLPSANHVNSLWQRFRIGFKQSFQSVSRLLYPIKITCGYFFKFSSLHSFIATLTFREFIAVLVRTRGYRMNALSAMIYLRLKYSYDLNEKANKNKTEI